MAVKHDPASAAVVRRMLAEELTAHALQAECIDDAVLVASELVGNAVVHTDDEHEDLDIGWSVEDTSVVVWVADSSDVIPEPKVTDTLATSGRGLAIVAAVATEWGVERLQVGKRVWARIRVTT